MKMFIIRTASFLALPVGIALLNVSLGSTAYGQQSASNKQVCESIPPARPTGGATLQRMQALQECYKNIPQNPIQSSVREDSAQSNTGGCQIPLARPTGGATMLRLEAMQQCRTGVKVIRN